MLQFTHQLSQETFSCERTKLPVFLAERRIQEMDKMVKDRIKALRARMKEQGIDACMIPTDDYHASEYVGTFFKCRTYITGFTGSAGTAVVTQDMAGLWTDARYFIQAERQLSGSGVDLYRMHEPGVPTVEAFLKQTLKKGQRLGFDGRCVGAKSAEKLVKELKAQGVETVCDVDLVGDIWTDRPALSCEPAWELDMKWAGKSREDKISEIRGKVAEAGADLFLLTKLEDIAWLLNIRGNDIHTVPVVLSYLMMSKDEIRLYANEKAFSAELTETLAKAGVTLHPYNDIYKDTAAIKAGKKVLLDRGTANYLLVQSIPEGVELIDRQNPTLLAKAVKNPVEVENERIAHIKDGVAVTKFMYWLKTNVGKMKITECSAAEYLNALRKEQEHFVDNSFDPIVSYGEHAAMNHYSPSPETDVEVEPHGLLLADTGGHYLEGSTDITRTFAMGPITEDERWHYTAVLRGHLALANAKFLYGCTGINLDYLAREPLWERGEDFKHGTGHGVGYLLSVHEAPNGFRWKRLPDRQDDAVLEEGMITSNEPGYYVEGGYGIRHENMIVCKKAEKNEYGQYMCFENLTMAPFDLDAIDPEQMSEKERAQLNRYHAEVYEKIAPHLTEEEQVWLKHATREI